MRKIAFAALPFVLAFGLTLAVASATLWLFGSNPLEAFGDMIGHARKLETQVHILNRATPLFLSAVAAALGFRMNLFNIGVEGQYLLAAIVAAQVGGMISLPQVLHIAVIFVVAMVVGALWAGIAGVLNVTRGVNVVISTIMLNIVAISGLMAWWVRAWQPETDIQSSTVLGTKPIEDSGLLPNINSWVEPFTGEIGKGGELTGMLIIAIVVGVAYYVVLNRTRFGFDLRATGMNPFAAKAGGVAPKQMIVAAMLLSGAVAGLVGLVEVMDIGKFRPNQIQGLGFAGIAVALLGRNNAVGMGLAALLFGFLDVSAGILQSTQAASREIVVIMQGIVLLAAVIAYEITRRIREQEEARAAAEALGASA